MELKCKKINSDNRIWFFLIFFAAIMIFANSCKISYSLSGASTKGLSTVNIQLFQNRANLVQPGLSQSLTDALIDKCKSETNLKVTNGLGDASFEGEITNYETRPQTVSADATAASNRFTITVKVKYTNSVDPDLSFEQTFSRYEDYSGSQDLSSVEDELSGKIVEMIVEDIFNAAFVNW